MRKAWQMAGAAVLLGAAGLSVPAQAGDFFSNLFGAFGVRPPAPRQQMRLPYGESPPFTDAPRAHVAYSGGKAWCVRTCDGRYFPIVGNDATASCSGFCPASQTELVYGNDIDHAATSSGKPYSSLPNAFKYRSEMVAGCTCNGKDSAGLAPVSIDNDPTLRKGDIVAGADGLRVANPGSGRRAELNFTPVPPAAQARIKGAPVVARE
jgi:hypothetical protein